MVLDARSTLSLTNINLINNTFKCANASKLFPVEKLLFW